MLPEPDRKPAKYVYRYRYNSWVIYEITQAPTGRTEAWFDSYKEEEDARREVYRLNGWQNYKPKKTIL